MKAKDDADEQNSTQELLRVARERFQLAVDAEIDIRRDQLDDMRFLSGEQWPEVVKQSRELDRRPCLTINRLPQFVRQVTNDQRQNRPSIKVNPTDDKATIETAKVFEGIIRHIEYNSNADIAYDTAFEQAAAGGRGYMRVITDYADERSFDQEIFIKRIRNSFSVYLDPSSQEPDGSDANWGFIFETLSRDEFKSTYPDSSLSQMEDWTSIGDQSSGWVSKGACRVAEYFYKTFKEITVIRLSNGEVFTSEDLPELRDELQIVAERRSVLPAIKWCKTNGMDILEETDWLGDWIPIIPVLGDEYDIDGKRILEGIVRHAKDPQRMYNYWATSETETIALAPRAPFIGVEGQFEGHESEWKTANTRNHAYLEYKAKSIAGEPAGPPSRNTFEPPVQAITQARMASADDLKATTGIYDASLGNRSNEQSGIAIQRRNAQAQTTNFHYMDNFSRSHRHLGRIIVDLIPKVYSDPQVIRMIADDGEVQMVAINQVFAKNGKTMRHQLNAGKYDVTISSGPSYETKRQEAVASMADLTRSYPQIMQIAGDLMVRNMDWPGAQQIADRLKKLLPPGTDDSDQQMQIPPQVQAQMNQMNQLIQGLTQELNAKTEIVKNKSLELESRERIEMAKIQADIGIALAKTGSSDAQALLKHEVDSIKHRLNLLHDNFSIQSENMAGPQMAAPQSQPQPTGGISPGQPMGV